MEREDCCFPFFLLHLFFPLLLHWVYCLPMIAWLLLIAIGIGILLLTGTFLWHLWLGVPYVPTPAKVVESMVDLAKLRPDDCVLDLGAGDGRFLGQRVPRFVSLFHDRAIRIGAVVQVRSHVLQARGGLREEGFQRERFKEQPARAR